MTLRDYANKYETVEFLKEDPSQFMHRCQDPINQELTGFIASCLAMGNREQICKKVSELMEIAKNDFYTWIRGKNYLDALPNNDVSFYRIYSNRMFKNMFDGLHDILHEYGSIGGMLRLKANDGPTALQVITEFFCTYQVNGLIPMNLSSSCKRLCMFLRWMVRDHSPVDIGLWSDFIDKRSLIMPLDTHVLQEAVRLGFLNSKTATMRTAILLTNKMKEIFPEDPLKGDFALFGIGINNTSGLPKG